ncbi:MAG TPA: hypothetical protein VF125_08195 [Solirubrobacterales bacterium]
MSSASEDNPDPPLPDWEADLQRARDEQSSFIWKTLIPRLLHPIKVDIIETMLWMEQPLSASELTNLFGKGEEQKYLSKVSYHARSLKKLGVLELQRTRPVRGAVESFYVFAEPEK